MALVRPTIVNDSGGGTDGTIIDAAWLTDFQDRIDAAIALGSNVWATPTFAAGDFTAQGAMTWTVDAGDRSTFAYTISGKTMTVSFLLATTTIGGTLSFRLRMKIPASKVASKTMINPIWIANNGVFSIGYAQVDPGGTNIDIYLINQGNFAAGTNNNYFYGQITFEIN